MQDFRSFLKEIITLKTVWIDKGEGRWVVKKRMHPFLKGVIGVTVLIAGASVYMNFPELKKLFSSQKAEAEPGVKISRLIDYEPDKLRASLPTINIPESNPKPEPVLMKRESLTLPLNDASNSFTSSVVNPAKTNANNSNKNNKNNKSGMIITAEPDKIFGPAPSARPGRNNDNDNDNNDRYSYNDDNTGS